MTTAAVELAVDVKSPRTSGTTRAEGAALPSPGPTQPGHLTTSFVDTAIQMQRDLRVTPKWLIDPHRRAVDAGGDLDGQYQRVHDEAQVGAPHSFHISNRLRDALRHDLK